jgi:hypothetical protein
MERKWRGWRLTKELSVCNKSELFHISFRPFPFSFFLAKDGRRSKSARETGGTADVTGKYNRRDLSEVNGEFTTINQAGQNSDSATSATVQLASLTRAYLVPIGSRDGRQREGEYYREFFSLLANTGHRH